ncbi:MAG: 4Fe-4S binding protein [Promethearchaeota archaeon]
MEKTELYERLRKLLSTGKSVIGLPKHPITQVLLENMYMEDEAALIVSAFKKCGEPLSLRAISKASGMPKEDLKKKLEDMYYKGKLMKVGTLYMVLPYLPGGFEVYFTLHRDDPERMKKAAEAHAKLGKLGLSFELSASSYPVYRVIPAIQPTERLIEISEGSEVKYQVLPHEILKEYLAKAQPPIYSVVPCSCRTAAKLAGHPCKRTDENFCIATGMLAKTTLDQGIGKEVTLEELLSIMEKAEKEGLVHETFNMQDTAMFVCNCCSCCCGFLKSVKEHKNYGSIIKSNFEPRILQDACNLCETCIRMCPMEAIYHHWPHEADLSDNMIIIRKEVCIGCGICASNCPSNAIVLEKVRNYIPVINQAELTEKRAMEKFH